MWDRTTNLDIREYAKNKGVRMWEIAQVMNIDECSFSRKYMRREMDEESKTKVRMAIDMVANSRK